jgi:hypothetical protein
MADKDEERKREEALRSTDARYLQPQYRPRMRMLADEPLSLAELGTRQESFIDSDEAESRSIRHRLRRKLY